MARTFSKIVYLNKEEAQALEKLAEETGNSESSILRMLLKNALRSKRRLLDFEE